MAEGYKSKHINPPDLSNIARTALVSGDMTLVTSTGGWYCVRAINTGVSGPCSAFMLDENQVYYLQASEANEGMYRRATTSWVYFAKGVKFYARGIFTDDSLSGLLFANELNL